MGKQYLVKPDREQPACKDDYFLEERDYDRRTHLNGYTILFDNRWLSENDG